MFTSATPCVSLPLPDKGTANPAKFTPCVMGATSATPVALKIATTARDGFAARR